MIFQFLPPHELHRLSFPDAAIARRRPLLDEARWPARCLHRTHAKKASPWNRRSDLSRHESRSAAPVDLRRTRRLCDVCSGTPRRHRPISDATSVLGRHAEPLASRAVAAGRRRSIGIHGLDHLYPLATLACRSRFSRYGNDLSGPVQGDPGEGRRSLPDGLPVRGAEPGARPLGAAGWGLGLEQCHACAAPAGPPVTRVACATATELGGGHERGRIVRRLGACADGNRSRCSFWTEGLARRNRESSRLAK